MITTSTLYIRQGMCLIISQIPYSAVLLGKLTVTQLVKKLSKGSSLPHAQQQTIRPCTKPLESSQHNPHMPFVKTHFNIILPFNPQLSSGFFPLWFPTEKLYLILISPIHATCPNSPIHILLKSTNYEAPKLATIFSLVSLFDFNYSSQALFSSLVFFLPSQ